MDNKTLLQIRLIFSLLLLFAVAVVCHLVMGLSLKITIVAAVIGIIIGYKLPYIQLIMQKKAAEQKNANMFTDFSQAMTVLIPTKRNVLATIKSANEFTQSPLKEKVEELIKNIEVHGDVREDYLKLADYINTPEAHTVLDQFYKFSVQGYSDEVLEKQQRLIREIQINKMEFIIENKTSGMVTYGIIPVLLGIMLMFGIISVILVGQIQSVFSSLL